MMDLLNVMNGKSVVERVAYNKQAMQFTHAKDFLRIQGSKIQISEDEKLMKKGMKLN